jgi:hypothetical protein
MSDREGSVMSAMLWMFVLSILLFWVPVLGPLVAGFVGGRKAGGVGNAVLAVFLPGVIFGLAFFFLATMLTAMPLFGVIAGLGGLALAMIHVGPLLLGAILGAVL